jgi:hypothetical protein
LFWKTSFGQVYSCTHYHKKQGDTSTSFEIERKDISPKHTHTHTHFLMTHY